MHFGLIYSTILHSVVILIFIFGIPYTPSLPQQQDTTILLELVEVSSITNVQTSTKSKKDIEEKKPIPTKNEKDNKENSLKESEHDNPNVSKKQIQLEEKTVEKPSEEKRDDSKTIQEEKKEVIEAKPVVEPKLEEKKPEKKDNNHDDSEKIPTKDLKKKEEKITKDKVQKNISPSQKQKVTKENKKEKKTQEKTKQEKKNSKDIKPKKVDQKKKSTSDDELANSVLKSLQEGGKKASKKSKNPKQPKDLNDIMNAAIKGDTTSEFDENKEMSMSELDSIRAQVSKAWRVTAFSGGGENTRLRVKAIVKVDKNGKVQDIKIKRDMMGSATSESLYKAFIESITRAIYSASPFQDLPEEKYETWNEMEMTFDSNGMIY